MKEFFSQIQKIDLFKGVFLEKIEEIFVKNLYDIKVYKKNSVIYFQNEKCMRLDVVLDGIVSIQGIDDNGNYVLITDFNTGKLIGGNLLFSHKNFYPMTIIAKTDVTILHLKKDLILKLCQSNLIFLTNFLADLSDKTLILADKIQTLSLKSIRQSIIEFLLKEYKVQKNNKIKLKLSKKSLAEKFGIQRTSLSRELSKMKNEGLIDYDAYSITIIDIELLKNYKYYK